jgi:hypothetical protein
MMHLPSPQADAALAYLAADDEALFALRYGDPLHIRKATGALTEAMNLRRELSDARYEIGLADSRVPPATDGEMLALRERAHRLWQMIEELKAARLKVA